MSSNRSDPVVSPKDFGDQLDKMVSALQLPKSNTSEVLLGCWERLCQFDFLDCTNGELAWLKGTIGNLALEMSEKSEPVREKIALNFENWRIAIRQCLIDAGDRLSSDVDRDKLATFILTVMEGAVMQARARRSLQPFDDSIEILREYCSRLVRAEPA